MVPSVTRIASPPVAIRPGYARVRGGRAPRSRRYRFAHVILERHGKTHSDAFEAAVAGLPEVMDCFSVSREADYLLRVVAQDLPAFSELMMKRVLRLPGVARITTNIALQRVKQTHVLPLDHLTQPARSRQNIRYSGGGT